MLSMLQNALCHNLWLADQLDATWIEINNRAPCDGKSEREET